MVAKKRGTAKAKAEEEQFTITLGVRELPDSTLDRPVVAFSHFGFPIGRSLESDIRYVADVAMTEAKKMRDPIVIDCARTLDAVELALRRKRTGATDKDRQALRKLEVAAREYLSTRTHDERWNGAALPARAGVDRDARIAWLGSFAETVALARFNGRGRKAEHIALMMTSEVWRANVIDTSGRKRDEDIRRLENVVRTRSREGIATSRKLTAHSLVVCALKACGVTHVDAHNWCKPLL